MLWSSSGCSCYAAWVIPAYVTTNKTYPTKSSEDWCCSFFFRVEATTLALQEAWLSVETRICPASVLNHMRQVQARLTFKPDYPTMETALSHLQAIAVNLMEYFRGILDYFFSRTSGSNRKYLQGHLRARPMALDRKLVVAEPSDRGGSSVDGLWEHFSPQSSPAFPSRTHLSCRETRPRR